LLKLLFHHDDQYCKIIFNAKLSQLRFSDLQAKVEHAGYLLNMQIIWLEHFNAFLDCQNSSHKLFFKLKIVHEKILINL
jgi:hypothetical protein